MLIDPPKNWNAPAYEFAEWLELLSIVRWPYPSGEAELRAYLEGAAGDMALFSNADEMENAIESKVQSVFEELGNRVAWADGGYAFSIKKGLVELNSKHDNINARPDEGAAYLFALLATFYRHTYYANLPLPKAKNDKFPQSGKLEDLFQVCGSIAASGLVNGHSISFGFPRRDKSPFYERLMGVGKELTDGVPKTGWEPGASPNPKDAKVDIIAWRPCPDRLPGQLYVLGQCASGDNWEHGKTPVIDHDDFHEYYWSQRPHSPLITATFIPFDFRVGANELPCDKADALKIERWKVTKSHGIIVDRFRLAHYFASGLENMRSGQHKVDCEAALPEVVGWIEKGIEFVRN